ncbi:MAG TPA: hypothetical protein VF525_03775 [Pyrinomonadaceae bacterium]|jgi:hypothetical protein
MKATLTEKTEVYIRCAGCGDESSYCGSNIDPGTSFGPWYCNNCGAGIRGYVDGTGVIEIEEAEYRKEPTSVLLRVLPQNEPIFLIVQGADFIPQYGATGNEPVEGTKEFLDSDEFFYSHGSYPSLILRNTLAVIRGTDFAPCDIFQHVATRPALHPACEYNNQSVLMDVFRPFIQTLTDESINKRSTHNGT